MVASVADWMGLADYPSEKLTKSWNLVLGSQFHDILPGTSIPKAYEYAWNDEFIAANGFAEVLKNSVKALSSKMNTQTTGRSILVFNPVASSREDMVSIRLTFPEMPANIAVFDGEGREVPSQITGRNGKELDILFLAKMHSAGFSVFDVRMAIPKISASSLKVTGRTLENDYYKVSVAENGDIAGIFDKKIRKELLSKPAGLDFQSEEPSDYPAWNMDWKDRRKPPVDHMNKQAIIRIAENGPVRISLEVKRKGMNSEITQVYSLFAGSCGRRMEVTNHIDWQSEGVSLKAAFPLTVSNEMATYNLGVGTIQRGTNTEKKFEVPSKEWFDLTDKSGKYGVTILEDCKYGSDKPDKNTLRLTLLYTPKADRFKFQSTQDWGIHDFRYGIYSHSSDWRKSMSQLQGCFFNEPLIAFETDKHPGIHGKNVSLFSLSANAMGVMAFKKMEDSDYYLIRVNELEGKDQRKLKIYFPGKIIDAYEVNGQEQKIGDACFSGNSLTFGLSHYTIRSFALKFENSGQKDLTAQAFVNIPYNEDVFSFDHNRSDGNFDGHSYPAELISREIVSEAIRFRMGSTEDTKDNALSCLGQEIRLPAGSFNKLYLLAAADKETDDTVYIDNQPCLLHVDSAYGFVGQFYNRELNDDFTLKKINDPFVIKSDIAWFASHRHTGYPSKNDAYRYCYLFKYVIDIPVGSTSIKLPTDKHIRIFAATVADEKHTVIPLQPLYDEFKNPAIRLRNQNESIR